MQPVHSRICNLIKSQVGQTLVWRGFHGDDRSRPRPVGHRLQGGEGDRSGIRGASRAMHHGCTPRGASRYISHRERAPTAAAKLSLCHKVSRKRGCSRGGKVQPGGRRGPGRGKRTTFHRMNAETCEREGEQSQRRGR